MWAPRARHTATGSQCFVRVTRANHLGFIEFQFAIGDPNLYLEMTLPPAAFAEFCATHAVRQLSAAEGAAVDAAARRWHGGDSAHEDSAR